MTNSAKHAKATAIRVSIVRRNRSVSLMIDDDGVGFGQSHPRQADIRGVGLGMFGMEERVALVGGRLDVHQLQPHGVGIVATIPLAPSLVGVGAESDGERIMVP